MFGEFLKKKKRGFGFWLKCVGNHVTGSATGLITHKSDE